MNKLEKIAHRGAGGGGKSGGASGSAPVEQPDNLRSIQYAKVLDLISEGEIGGLVDGLRSVYLNDTPVRNPDGTLNFRGVTMDSRTGTQAQLYMPGFSGAESETGVGAEVKYAVSITRTVADALTTDVRLTLGFPQMSQIDIETGDMNGTTVQIAIDVQNNGGGFIAQVMRYIWSTSKFSISGTQGITTVNSTQFHVDMGWLGTTALTVQTCKAKLQYRAVGDITWIDGETYSFSGKGSAHTSDTVPGNDPYGNLLDWNTTSGIIYVQVKAAGQKTFNLTLADDTYEFRAVKISGIGDVKIAGGEIYEPLTYDTITGKCTSRYQRSYRIAMPAGGPWDIRVRRLTADSASSALQNKTYWDSFTEIVDAKLGYPNSAYIGLKVDSKQFSSIPARGFDIYGMLVKIPVNYDPLTLEYDGAWDGTFQVGWTNNPAWVFYDMVINARYGLGEFVDEDQVDKWALYTIAQYCDELVADGFGNVEPRFTCNLFLQTREQAFTVIANLASVFRGIAWWSAGAITASQDAPADVVQLFSAANVVNGEFSYTGSSGRVRHSVVLVSWNDPQDAYRQKVEYVEDAAAIARYGVIQSEVVAMGCTSRGQAHRVGKWMIYSEQNETEIVTFRTGLASAYCGPGDIIQTADPVRAGARFGGRLIAADTVAGPQTQLQLDAYVTLEAGHSYTLSCVLPDGTVESRPIVNAPMSFDVVNVSPQFSVLPQVMAMWILSSDELIPESWRIVSMTEVDKINLDIVALAYRPDKYAAVEQNLVLQPLPYSLIETDQPDAPINLTFSEALYLSGVAVVAVKGTVGWEAVGNSVLHVLTYQRTDQNPVTITGIIGSNVEIEPMAEGDYTITVYAVTALNLRSQAININVTVHGKTTPPSDVTSFHMVALSGYAHLTWDPASDLDVQVGGYMRIRFMPDFTPLWTSAIDIGPQIPGSQTHATLPLLTGGYLAKWIDSSGNESANAVNILSNEANLIGMNQVFGIDENGTGFIGTKTNVVVDAYTMTLKLSGVGNFDALAGNFDALVGNLDALGGIAPSGIYDFYFGSPGNNIDLFSVQTSRLAIILVATTFDAADLISLRGDVSTWPSISGEDISDAYARIEVQTTTDDPSGSPTWSAWQPFFVGDWTARAFKFRCILSTDNPAHNIAVASIFVAIDMPDRDEWGKDITSGAGAMVISYPVSFVNAPAVSITAQNMATGDYYVITTKTADGFTITFKNAAGTNISRIFDFHAKGW